MGNNFTLATVDHLVDADELAALGLVPTGRVSTLEAATSTFDGADGVGVARTGGRTLLADAEFTLADLIEGHRPMRGQWYIAVSSDVSGTYVFASILDGVELGRAMFLESEGEWTVRGELPGAVREFLAASGREGSSTFNDDIVELPGELVGVPFDVALEVEVFAPREPAAG